MNPIGGFLDLELGEPRDPYHAGAESLWNGRACLRRILDVAKPAEALVPFYICDTALQAFQSAQVPYTFYAVDAELNPLLPDRVNQDAWALYVDYFGLKRDAVDRVLRVWAGRAIIDETHAFYQRGYPSGWSFNSARKFFGVPDGAYAYGPGLAGFDRTQPASDAPYAHLLSRLAGDPELAYRQYQDAEAVFDVEPRPMSRLSERLLAAIDYERVRRIRRRNFAHVHERLGSRNRLPLPLGAIGDVVPFCYPLLPDHTIARSRLWSRGIYVPTLWSEVTVRAGDGLLRFDRERDLACRLLPLPIDQRYSPDDMDRMCREVSEEMAG